MTDMLKTVYPLKLRAGGGGGGITIPKDDC